MANNLCLFYTDPKQSQRLIFYDILDRTNRFYVYSDLRKVILFHSCMCAEKRKSRNIAEIAKDRNAIGKARRAKINLRNNRQMHFNNAKHLHSKLSQRSKGSHRSQVNNKNIMIEIHLFDSRESIENIINHNLAIIKKEAYVREKARSSDERSEEQHPMMKRDGEQPRTKFPDGRVPEKIELIYCVIIINIVMILIDKKQITHVTMDCENEKNELPLAGISSADHGECRTCPRRYHWPRDSDSTRLVDEREEGSPEYKYRCPESSRALSDVVFIETRPVTVKTLTDEPGEVENPCESEKDLPRGQSRELARELTVKGKA